VSEENMKKSRLNSDKIWKVWKKDKLKSEKIWKIWKTYKVKSNHAKLIKTLIEI
jgi:hypothetical protein